MLRQLKQVLLKIARLPAVDQRWILHQLSAEQRIALQNHQGLEILKAARRFRKLPQQPPEPLLATSEALPTYCQQLAGESPLYAAIVIEQGLFPWRSRFLSEFDIEGTIQSALNCQVPDIKSPVKQALFHEWEARLSFDGYLENQHG